MKLPRYPKYKDSGVQWLGQVPEHWEICRLERYSKSIKEQVSTEIMAGRSVFHYSIPNVQSTGDGLIEEGDSIDSAKLLIKQKALLISKLNPRKSTVCIALPHDDLTVYSSEFVPLAPSKVDAQFLYYVAISEPFRQRLDSLVESVTRSHQRVAPSDILKTVWAFPPKCEQQTVTDFLDKSALKIEALIVEQRRLIELLKEKRQAIISHAVTKGLNPGAPMKPSGIEWLGDIPAHWAVVRLKFMAYVQGGVAKGRNLEGQKTVEVPYLRVANVQDGYLDLDDIATIEIPPAELKRYALKHGDVLMNEGGDFDKLGRGHIWREEIPECIHQNHVFAVRPQKVESEWLNTITSAECGRFYFMSRSKQSTNLASISSTNIQELPVPCPPQEEERIRIIEYVHEKVRNLDLLIANAESNIDLLQERRSALITAAVTGQIDVRNYRPEEASAVCQ
jgi:type I restriction enzyme S subunit